MKCVRCGDEHPFFEMVPINRLCLSKRVGDGNNPIKDDYCPYCATIVESQRKSLGLEL